MRAHIPDSSHDENRKRKETDHGKCEAVLQTADRKKKKKKHLTSAVNILTKVFAKILGKIFYP